MSTEKVDGGIGGSGGERDQLFETLFEKALFVGLMRATIPDDGEGSFSLLNFVGALSCLFRWLRFPLERVPPPAAWA